jgi:hypothetical protein
MEASADNKDLKIRAIKSKKTEEESRYIVLDNFKSKRGEYFCGVRVYECQYTPNNNKSIRGRKNCDIDMSSVVDKLTGDIDEKPNIEMYLALGEALKKRGYIFNKKTRQVWTTKRNPI